MSYPNAKWDTQSIAQTHSKVDSFIRRALYETPVGDPAY